jgi:transcriptional regulator with XRE-family HTH domain
MGKYSRQRPARLAEKLLQIRMNLGLSQNELISRLGLTDKLLREDISNFERDVREPSLEMLLRYARSVGISTDVLIDDEMDLPARLLKPSTTKRGSGRPATRTRSKR